MWAILLTERLLVFDPTHRRQPSQPAAPIVVGEDSPAPRGKGKLLQRLNRDGGPLGKLGQQVDAGQAIEIAAVEKGPRQGPVCQ